MFVLFFEYFCWSRDSKIELLSLIDQSTASAIETIMVYKLLDGHLICLGIYVLIVESVCDFINKFGNWAQKNFIKYDSKKKHAHQTNLGKFEFYSLYRLPIHNFM